MEKRRYRPCADKAVPLTMASGPHEYVPGDQELPVQLTSLADMLSVGAELGSLQICLAPGIRSGMLRH